MPVQTIIGDPRGMRLILSTKHRLTADARRILRAQAEDWIAGKTEVLIVDGNFDLIVIGEEGTKPLIVIQDGTDAPTS